MPPFGLEQTQTKAAFNEIADTAPRANSGLEDSSLEGMESHGSIVTVMVAVAPEVGPKTKR
jgi:hypothetical protein